MGFISLVVLICFSLISPVYTGSWDSYINNVIGHTAGQVDKACIIGLDDGESWTTADHSNALILEAGEGADIAVPFRTKDFSTFQASGIQAEGVKYQFLRSEEKKDGTVLVLGKKKDNGAITMQSSKTAIVIAHTKKGGSQGHTNKGVAVIAEYLASLDM
ncbi:profilin-like [Antedon mediterranea]|uniref:profilin-like n=1 Tax=Antedon mediterranea TaxID=105859 RepID=UPI003AF87A89